MFDTVFRRVDLSHTRGLETIVHDGPSTIGIDTLLRSRGKVPLGFLLGTGIPKDAAISLLEWAGRYGLREQFHSVFISYGGPDEPFARKLTMELTARGVETFCFAEHAEPGMKLLDLMHTKANDYDRVLLICSQHSLERAGVLNELEEVLRREAREGGASVLIPLAVDDYVYSGWSPSRRALSRAIRDRVIADFRGASGSESVFHSALERLFGVLRRTK